MRGPFKPHLWGCILSVLVANLMVTKAPPARVREVGPDGMEFTGTLSAGGDLFAGPLATNIDLATTVKYYDHFAINWSVRFEPSTVWLPVRASDQRLYVTLENPITQAGDALLETYVYIGCKAANGASDTAGVFNGIWSHVQTKGVKRADGTSLRYWTESLCPPGTVTLTASGLVGAAVGQCHSWVALMQRVLKAQGDAGAQAVRITPNREVLPLGCGGPTHPNNRALRFLVKDYGFGEPQSECAPYPYRYDSPCIWPDADAWPASDTSDLNGVGGQNAINPPSEFRDHGVVQYNEKYYDPSYGAGPFATPSDWERASIAGFIAAATEPVGNVKSKLGARKENPNVLETEFTPLDEP